MSETVPVEYAEGPDETTVWVWADTPDSLTIRFPSDEWKEILQKAERDYNGDVEQLFSDSIHSFIEGQHTF